MFNNKKIKNLKNELDSKKGFSSAPVSKAGASDFIIARITAVGTGSVIKYSWSGIKLGSGYTWVDDPMTGKSSDTSKAICLQEINVDMTGKDPLAAVGAIVLLYRTLNCICFSAAGILNVRYDYTVDKFYKTDSKGEETVWAESTLHEHA